MSSGARPLVVRLNAETFGMSAEERAILGQVQTRLVEMEGTSDEQIAAAVREADAVMVVSAYLRTPVIAQMRRCKVISRLGTGVDKIGVDQATRQGIIVTNLPDFCTEEVADHTMALLLAAARQLAFYESEMRQGRQPRDVAHMHRLSERTLGIVGLGRIGRAVARRARAFGMRILACDPQLTAEAAAREGITAVEMDVLLAESDYVALLCPLTPATREMMTMRAFERMKPGAVLVNTARGELVNEADLACALREGIIRYAALDVSAGIDIFAPEGFPTDHPYFSLDNVLLTPHVAAYSAESTVESHRGGARAVVDVLSGVWPQHPVNPEVVPWFPVARLWRGNAVASCHEVGL